MNKNRPIKRQIDAAAYADVTPRTVRRWTKMGMPRTPEGDYYPDQLLKWKQIKHQRKFIAAKQARIPEQIQSVIRTLREIEAKLEGLFD